MARSVIRGGDEGRAVLGLSVTSTGTVRDTLGAFVASVVPDGPAERAGVYEGARIVALNGVDLRLDPADTGDRVIGSATAIRLERELARLQAGDEVTLRVYDGGRMRDVRVRTAKASDVYDDLPGALRLGPGGTFVFPASTMPASRRRWTASASACGTWFFHCGAPHVVRMPAVSKLSLIVAGTPRRGAPRMSAGSSSNARAC
jgi:hypothetical protein